MNLNDIITKNDLAEFKIELLAEIQKLISKPELPESFLKSKDVKRLLGCNDSTLQYYRDSGAIPFKRMGGTYYYSKEALSALLG